jgi:hypothetical protein
MVYLGLKNYATRARPSTPSRSHKPKKKNISFDRASADASRKGNKKRQEMRKSISRKGKHMRFAATWRQRYPIKTRNRWTKEYKRKRVSRLCLVEGNTDSQERSYPHPALQ